MHIIIITPSGWCISIFLMENKFINHLYKKKHYFSAAKLSTIGRLHPHLGLLHAWTDLFFLTTCQWWLDSNWHLAKTQRQEKRKKKTEFSKLKRPALHLHHIPPNRAEWRCYRPAACRERWRKISWSSDLSNLPVSFRDPRVGVNTKRPLPTHTHFILLAWFYR